MLELTKTSHETIIKSNQEETQGCQDSDGTKEATSSEFKHIDRSILRCRDISLKFVVLKLRLESTTTLLEIKQIRPGGIDTSYTSWYLSFGSEK